MKLFKVLLILIVVISVIGEITVRESLAETRTLSTRLVVTVKAPQSQMAPAPKGLEDLYTVALVQAPQRFVKVEDPMNTPSGMPRYTLFERL